MSEEIDLLINARWVVPVDSERQVLDHHSVAVHDGKIVALLPHEQARTRFQARTTFELGEHVLIPGLVNLHVHAAMSLMRGIADDLPLMQWLNEAIWPAEGKHVSYPFVYDGTLLAATEMMAGGITTCSEMYFYPEAAAAAFDQIGMRAVIGLPVLDFPTAYASDPDDYLSKGLLVRDKWKSHPRLRFSLAPHAPYTVSDAPLERIAMLSAELDIPIHIHIHETAIEVSDSVAKHGVRPIERLARLGVLGSNMIGIHAVHLDASDIDLLSRYNCSIGHCPSSNMKLASGIAPIGALEQRGLRIGLGSDGAASNNRLDLFQEMRQAALLAKVSTGDAAALPAHRVLRMATLDAAEALSLEESIGSITPGKQADLCAVSLAAIETRPCFDPVSHLIFVAGREHVSHVWIDGEARVNGGKQLLQTHNSDLPGITAMWQHKLVGE